MAGKFEIKKSKGQFMFNLKAANGRVILTSERYKSKASAQSGIKSVQKNASQDASFDRKKAKNGKPYFVMTAGNREVIGRSEMYSSTSSCENGIASIKRHAKSAKLDDLT